MQSLSQPPSSLGLARLSEAVILREAGIKDSLCLLEGVTTPEELELAAHLALDLVVHSPSQLQGMKSVRQGRDYPGGVWLKVDTGMGRLGFKPEQLDGAFSDFRLLGLMTHLANADDVTDAKTADQYQLLMQLSRQYQSRYPAAAIVSVANSAGILGHDLPANWIRPGTMLYGASPLNASSKNASSKTEAEAALAPAMTFTAPIIAIRQVCAGESVGYGGIWTAPADTRLAVVAAGYADGYPREIAPDAPVLIGNERRPIVGRVSMDMLMVELQADDKVAVNDRVVLWGRGLPVGEIASLAGTLAYTLLCGVSARVSREYVAACS